MERQASRRSSWTRCQLRKNQSLLIKSLIIHYNVSFLFILLFFIILAFQINLKDFLEYQYADTLNGLLKNMKIKSVVELVKLLWECKCLFRKWSESNFFSFLLGPRGIVRFQASYVSAHRSETRTHLPFATWQFQA